jgi:hypothetical protein
MMHSIEMATVDREGHNMVIVLSKYTSSEINGYWDVNEWYATL